MTRNKPTPNKPCTLHSALCTVAFALMLSGCSLEMKPYHQFLSTGEYGWNCADTLRFHVKPATSNEMVDEIVEIRTDKGYPYKNLGMVVHTEILSKKLKKTIKTLDFIDTIEVGLTAKEGYEDGDQGVIYRNKSVHVRHLSLNEGDSIVIKVHHIMEDEQLQGVSDIGIKLEKLE